MSKVALSRGNDRYANVYRALELISDEIKLGSRIVVKPNFTSLDNQLAATHVDAVRAVLAYFSQFTETTIIVGEGTGRGKAYDAFKNYGYFDLVRHYNVGFMDLNHDETVEVRVLDSNFDPVPIRISKTIAESDLRISVCPPKTHDEVLYTGVLKNMVSGSVVRKQKRISEILFKWFPRWRGASGDDKIKLHQGYQATNLNLYELANRIPPHLSIIDGYTAMEGNGPHYGEPVDMRLALASTDFLACDAVGAWLMGMDVSQIGYLAYCQQTGLGEGDVFNIEIVGDKLEECIVSAKPHYNWEEQLNWKIIDHERYLKWLTALAGTET